MSSLPPEPSPSADRERDRDHERGQAHGVSPSGQRPRYLAVALVCALIFGAECWTEGCARLTFYRSDRDQSAELTSSIKDDADRERAEARYRQYVETADRARHRALPIAAATFVLGAALLVFAARGLAGRSNTRSALMQVVAAQAVLVVVSYFVIRDVRNAELDWEFERDVVQRPAWVSPEVYAEAVPRARLIRRWKPPTWLALRTVASALIILALSRQRSREFFDAAADAAEGR